jgi:hypothetical protein
MLNYDKILVKKPGYFPDWERRGAGTKYLV